MSEGSNESGIDFTKAATEGFIAKLPTDPELAKKGTESFERVLQKLPSNLRKVFLESVEIQGCFVGVTPEVGSENGNPLEELNPTELSQVTAVLGKEAPDMIVIRNGQVLINIRAAQQVIANYPEYFPEPAKTDPKDWLTTHQKEWRYRSEDQEDPREIRWGLLSGYPLTSVLSYCRSKGKETGFRVINKYGNIWYVGCNHLKDAQYLNQLDQIFEQSGIINVTAKYFNQQVAEK